MSILANLSRGLSKDDLAILGEIAVSMASLEYVVQAAIWWLLKLNVANGLIITGPLALNQKMEILSALAKKIPEKDSTDLIQAIAAIDKVRPERNRKLHAFWVHNEAAEKVAMTLGSDRRSYKQTTVATKDLEKTRNDINAAEAHLMHWYIGYVQAHPSSHNKPA